MSFQIAADPVVLRKYITWYIPYGFILIALGVFAIVTPGIATLAVELMIGWLLLFGGAFGILAVFSAGRTAPGFALSLLMSVVCILAGVILLARPVAGAITLTIILTAYLLAGGVVRIALALVERAAIPRGWVWVLLSGFVDIALAVIIMSGMPGAAGWVLGLLVGVNLVIMGLALVIAAMAVRRRFTGT